MADKVLQPLFLFLGFCVPVALVRMEKWGFDANGILLVILPAGLFPSCVNIWPEIQEALKKAQSDRIAWKTQLFSVYVGEMNTGCSSLRLA